MFELIFGVSLSNRGFEKITLFKKKWAHLFTDMSHTKQVVDALTWLYENQVIKTFLPHHG